MNRVIRSGLCHTQFYNNYFQGRISGNLLPAYWAAGGNFGDELTPMILKHYGFSPVLGTLDPNANIIWPRSGKISARLICVGSILHKIPTNFNGIIIGTGSGSPKTIKSLPQAKIFSVRGPLTKKCLGLKVEMRYGDPGVIVSDIFRKSKEISGRIGIIPHFLDFGHQFITNLSQKSPERIRVIDVRASPTKVIGEITKCSVVFSSSLHGLITADSFNIPNALFAIRENRPIKYDFKYMDYFLTVNENLRLIELNEKTNIEEILNITKVSKDIEIIKTQVRDTFNDLADNAGQLIK